MPKAPETSKAPKRAKPAFKFVPFKNSRLPLLLALSALLGILQLFYSGRMEFYFLDLQFLLAHSLTPSNHVSDDIVILLVDPLTQQRPSQKIVSRSLHTRILERLHRAGARVIAFDIAFTTPDNVADEAFSRTVARSGNVLAGETDDYETVNLLRDKFQALGSFKTLDFWQIPRKINLYTAGNTERKALSQEIVNVYNPQLNVEGSKSSIDSQSKSIWINYSNRPDYFPVFTYTELLSASDARVADEKHTPWAFFQDKIILIGYAQDQCILPDLLGVKWPGVYVHAYAVENLLHHEALKQVPAFINIVIILITLALLYWFSTQRLMLLKIAGPWIQLFLVFCLQFLLLVNQGLWLNLSSIYLGSITYLFLQAVYLRFKNIRELHKLETQLAEFKNYKEKITDTSSLKDSLRNNLIDNIFHDIKNHAVSLETGIKMMEERCQDDKSLSKRLRIIKTAGKNIEHLLKNLLEVKQLEEGKARLSLSDCTSGQILDLVCEELNDPLCELNHLTVNLELFSASFTIRTDPYLLGRVLHNLFNNAFKYSTPTGEVRLASEIRQAEIIISLFNTSKPLTAEQKEKIFEKYYQVDPASTSSKGLGLYFCRLVVEALGGRIWVESDQGGNYFRLSFRSTTSRPEN